jgi:hypothetical protein
MHQRSERHAPAQRTTSPGDLPAVVPGSTVYTVDGDRLGTVKALRGTVFKVAAPRQRDYWLSILAVRRASLVRVDLAVTKQALIAFKVREDLADPRPRCGP